MAHHDDDASKQPRHTNRLARETSPYLLQHQHNPVDWYAWGPEAFEAARAQDKPIFLSVGYSTCYWCHVMERQCFEVEAIAAEMNRRFINIKVDREERPDVDQLYMIAVQVLTRHGGWPMSVFLTPDLRPFFGGTYFPPADAHGRPGFVTVLRGIEDAYRNRRDDVEQTAQQLVGILRELSEPEARDGGGGGGGGGGSGAVTIDDRFLARLIERSTGDYDPEHGGFGSAPKFPRETLLELLLVRQRTRPDAGQMRMLLHTLDAMANGGIRDQLGGGFHRYSTDAQWLVPHFEIMLYDNAMLGWVYAEAHAQTSDPRYARVARELFDFVLREMTSPQGGFYTALDAEVDAQEGLSYLWTSEEVEETLGADDAALFARVYGLDQGPNFADPHHGTGAPDKSILFLADPAAAEQHHERLAPMRAKLKARRDQRKQPLLDTKIITSWNALMIRALAHGARLVGDPRYLHAATAAADFLLIHHRTPTGGLFRTSRDGVKKYDAFLDDYAFLVHALVAVGDASGDARWRDEALRLAGTMIDRFGDGGGAGSASASATAVGGAEGAEGAEGAGGAGVARGASGPGGPGAATAAAATAGGFYFTDRYASDLIVRQKTASDSPLPSGNAVAAIALLELGQPEPARRVLQAFASQLDRGAEGMSSMVEAALLYVRAHGPVDPTPAAAGHGGFAGTGAPVADASAAGGASANDSDASAAGATRDVASPDQVAAGVVAVRAAWAAPQQLNVHVDVLDAFHINAHQASHGLVPTALRLTGVEPADIAGIDYPPGEERRFAFAEEPIRIYHGAITIAVRFARATSDRPLSLRLTYQACDENACLPPITKQVEVPPA